MSWFFFAILDVFLGASANILRKILLRDDKSDAFGLAIIFQIMGGIIIGIAAFLHGFILPSIKVYALNFLFASIFWGLSTVTLFKAYQYLEASEVTIITTLEAIVIIITAHFALSETYTFINGVGTALIILAVIYISHISSSIKFSRGVWFAILASIFAGLGVVNDTFMIKHNDPLSYVSIAFILPGLFLLLIRPKVVTKMKPLFQPSLLIKNFVFTFVYSLSAVAFSFALFTGGEASQVGTIAQASIVVTVILATIILRERNNLLKKFICAILVTIGVLLMQ